MQASNCLLLHSIMKRLLYILLFIVLPSFVFAQLTCDADIEEGKERVSTPSDTIVMSRLDLSEPVMIDNIKNAILIFPDDFGDKNGESKKMSGSDNISYTQERFLRPNRMLAIHWTDKTPQCYLLSWPSAVAMKMLRINSTVLQLIPLSERFSLTIEMVKYEDYEE